MKTWGKGRGYGGEGVDSGKRRLVLPGFNSRYKSKGNRRSFDRAGRKERDLLRSDDGLLVNLRVARAGRPTGQPVWRPALLWAEATGGGSCFPAPAHRQRRAVDRVPRRRPNAGVRSRVYIYMKIGEIWGRQARSGQYWPFLLVKNP